MSFSFECEGPAYTQYLTSPSALARPRRAVVTSQGQRSIGSGSKLMRPTVRGGYVWAVRCGAAQALADAVARWRAGRWPLRGLFSTSGFSSVVSVPSGPWLAAATGRLTATFQGQRGGEGARSAQQQERGSIVRKAQPQGDGPQQLR